MDFRLLCILTLRASVLNLEQKRETQQVLEKGQAVSQPWFSLYYNGFSWRPHPAHSWNPE